MLLVNDHYLVKAYTQTQRDVQGENTNTHTHQYNMRKRTKAFFELKQSKLEADH